MPSSLVNVIASLRACLVYVIGLHFVINTAAQLHPSVWSIGIFTSAVRPMYLASVCGGNESRGDGIYAFALQRPLTPCICFCILQRKRSQISISLDLSLSPSLSLSLSLSVSQPAEAAAASSTQIGLRSSPRLILSVSNLSLCALELVPWPASPFLTVKKWPVILSLLLDLGLRLGFPTQSETRFLCHESTVQIPC